jgi:transposase
MSHHWSRELRALGHTVRLIPPAYVNPMSNARRMTPPMLRPSVRRCSGRTCASCRPKRPSSRVA